MGFTSPLFCDLSPRRVIHNQTQLSLCFINTVPIVLSDPCWLYCYCWCSWLLQWSEVPFPILIETHSLQWQCRGLLLISSVPISAHRQMRNHWFPILWWTADHQVTNSQQLMSLFLLKPMHDHKVIDFRVPDHKMTERPSHSTMSNMWMPGGIPPAYPCPSQQALSFRLITSHWYSSLTLLNGL